MGKGVNVARTLKRLGVECVDLMMVHRPDYLGDVDEIAAAFTRLRDQGKVRFKASPSLT